MQAKEATAFDLSREPAASRAAYGGSKFGEGCLLARRLVEVGIPFVEVFQDGWDTHANNFPKVKELSREVDPAMSSLITDLKSRALLDSTLVIWMGEFGRHPSITSKNGNSAGRQHYPRAWTTVLVGGGIKGGQVIGKTPAESQRRSSLYSSEPTSRRLPPPCGTWPDAFIRSRLASGALCETRRPRSSLVSVLVIQFGFKTCVPGRCPFWPVILP